MENDPILKNDKEFATTVNNFKVMCGSISTVLN